MAIEVRGMEETDWPMVRRLIQFEWEASHPVLEQDFFIWQHTGFGLNRGLHNTSLAFAGHELIGMRGVIPGEYQLFDSSGMLRVIQGGSFAMWIVAKDFRGQGIGGALLSHSESRLGMTVAVGSNESTSVPIYLKAGYKRIKGLHHWYTVLHRDGLQLLRGSVPHSFPYPQRPGSYFDDISEISDPKLMATIWKRFAEANRLTGLHRSPEFWTWRYLRHPKFRYFLHSNGSKTALSVSRIENVVLEGKTIRVLRIIEFIPSQDSKRSATSSDKNIAFLKELLAWATTLGCVAADFRSSQFELYFFLREAGFLVNRFETGLGNAGFAGQLNPLDYSARPINVHWKVNASIETGVQNLYITKADNDMDRPNRRGVRSRRLDD